VTISFCQASTYRYQLFQSSRVKIHLFFFQLHDRFRKPTAVWGGQEWTRITPEQVKGDEALKYYSINSRCGFIDEPFSARMNFWDTLPLNENDNELFSAFNERGQSGEDDGFFSSFITS